MCAEYGNGNDDDTIRACADMFGWLYGEGQKRAKRIAHYAAHRQGPGEQGHPGAGRAARLRAAPADRVRRMRSRSCSCSARLGKAAGETAEKCIKLFRALGIWLILGTQIPDKDSLPPGITRNINTRFCLSVADQIANDMILGTSMYKLGYRATVFEPVTEAGWGILAGIGKPGARRSFSIDNDQAAKVMARAIEARAAAGVLPEPRRRPGPPGRGRAGRRGRHLARRGRRRLERDPAGTPRAACARRPTPGGSPPSSPPPCPATASPPGRSAAASTARPSTGAARPAPTSSTPSPNVTGTGAAANRPAGASASAFPR